MYVLGENKTLMCGFFQGWRLRGHRTHTAPSPDESFFLLGFLSTETCEQPVGGLKAPITSLHVDYSRGEMFCLYYEGCIKKNQRVKFILSGSQRFYSFPVAGSPPLTVAPRVGRIIYVLPIPYIEEDESWIA